MIEFYSAVFFPDVFPSHFTTNRISEIRGERSLTGKCHKIKGDKVTLYSWPSPVAFTPSKLIRADRLAVSRRQSHHDVKGFWPY